MRLVVVILQEPRQTKESARRDKRPSPVYCVAVGHMFQMYGAEPHAPKPYGPKPYGPKPYAPKPYASETYADYLRSLPPSLTPSQGRRMARGSGRRKNMAPNHMFQNHMAQTHMLQKHMLVVCALSLSLSLPPFLPGKGKGKRKEKEKGKGRNSCFGRNHGWFAS